MIRKYEKESPCYTMSRDELRARHREDLREMDDIELDRVFAMACLAVLCRK